MGTGYTHELAAVESSEVAINIMMGRRIIVALTSWADWVAGGDPIPLFQFHSSILAGETRF